MSYDQNSSKQIDGTIITEGINWSKFSGMGYFYSVSADKVNLVMGLKEWHNWFEAAEKYEGKWEGKVTGFVSEESEEVEEHQRDARLVFIHALGALVAAFILKIELNKQQAVHPKNTWNLLRHRYSTFVMDGAYIKTCFQFVNPLNCIDSTSFNWTRFIFFFFSFLVLNSFADAARIVFLPVGTSVRKRGALLQWPVPARMVISGQWIVQRCCPPLPCFGYTHFQPDLRPQSMGSLPSSLRLSKWPPTAIQSPVTWL